MLPLRIESQYFGSVQYIKLIAAANTTVIDVHEPFKKMSYRNRTKITSAHGPLLLTVPLQNGRDQKSPMHDVKICYDQNWPSKHIKALTSCYKRSPFFEYYEEGVIQLLKKEHIFLIDLNMSILDWLQKVLKIDFNISKTIASIPYRDSNYIDVRDTTNKDEFFQNNLKQEYLQVFSDKTNFIQNASIIDLLFCIGPSSNIYLKDSHL